MTDAINEYLEEINTTVYPNSKSMQKYATEKLSNAVKTEGGLLIAFDKPSIETRFCFSYDEHVEGDIERASEASRVTEDYFIEYNLKELNRKLKTLELEDNEIYFLKNYAKSDKIVFFVTGEYKENHPTHEYFEATEADRSELIKAQKNEIEKFTKRLKTYLKRFGTEKLVTWTYSCWD